MIIVLSPAKSLDFTTPPTLKDYTQPDFLEQSQALVERLRPLSPLDLSEGSHLGYAGQWFMFALTFAVGYPFFVRQQQRHAAQRKANPDLDL